MAGVTGQDGLLTYKELQSRGTQRKGAHVVPVTKANITDTLRAYFGYDDDYPPGTSSPVDALYDLYVTQPKVDESDTDAMALAFLQMNSDVCLACPTTELLDDISNHKSVEKSWLYHFLHNPLPGFTGLCFHAGELNTVFGYLINPFAAAIFPPPDKALSTDVMERFYNYANGQPPSGEAGAASWAQYSSTQRNGLQFETPKPSAFTQLKTDKCQQW